MLFSLFAQEVSSGHSKFRKPLESPSGSKCSQNGQKRQALLCCFFFVFVTCCISKMLPNSKTGLFATVRLIFYHDLIWFDLSESSLHLIWLVTCDDFFGKTHPWGRGFCLRWQVPFEEARIIRRHLPFCQSLQCWHFANGTNCFTPDIALELSAQPAFAGARTITITGTFFWTWHAGRVFRKPIRQSGRERVVWLNFLHLSYSSSSLHQSN